MSAAMPSGQIVNGAKLKGTKQPANKEIVSCNQVGNWFKDWVNLDGVIRRCFARVQRKTLSSFPLREHDDSLIN